MKPVNLAQSIILTKQLKFMDKINVTTKGTVLLVSKRNYTDKSGAPKIFTEVSARLEGSERIFVFSAEDPSTVSSALEGKSGVVTLSLAQFKTGVFVRFVSVK